MNLLKIAVVGYGNMGRHHAKVLASGGIPNATLGAVVDTNATALDTARSLYPDADHFSSLDALIEAKAADAVMIATPHYFHPPMAIQSLNAGLHTLVEKPAGVYTKQVREMNEVAAKSDKVFTIMFNQRTNGAHKKMRDIVESGELGEIRRTLYVITDWFRSQSYYDSGGWRATWAGEGGGVLLNQSPHNLDLWPWITGMMPKRIRAFCSFGKYHSIEVEDDVAAYAEYENGATGVFITSTGESPGSKSFEVVGDRGKLVLAGNKVTFYRTVTSVRKFLYETNKGFDQPEVWTCDIPTQPGEEHIGIMKNWVNAILFGTPLIASGQEGINGVTLANAMLLSSWTDSWVDLPFDDDLYFAELQKRVERSTTKKDEGSKTFDLTNTF